MTPDTISHFARLMCALTLFADMLDDGVIEQGRRRSKTSAKVMTGATGMRARHPKYELTMWIDHGIQGNLRQCALMLSVASGAGFLFTDALAVKGEGGRFGMGGEIWLTMTSNTLVSRCPLKGLMTVITRGDIRMVAA